MKTCQIPCILTDLYPAVQVKYARKAVFAFISLIQPKKESQADRMEAVKKVMCLFQHGLFSESQKKTKGTKYSLIFVKGSLSFGEFG